MSTIESTVTRLLVATKQLLESLTQWARGDASEQDVSDVYVVLGNEFNVACRAFLASGIDVADLGDVPQALRVILERTLSEDASQYNLDRYLPSIREIIVTLLRQLKEKQTLLRQRPSSGQQYPQPPHQYQQQQQQPQQPQQYPPASVLSSESFPTQKYPSGRSVSHHVTGSAPVNVQYAARSESLNSNPRSDSRYKAPGSTNGSTDISPQQQSRAAQTPAHSSQSQHGFERKPSRTSETPTDVTNLDSRGSTPLPRQVPEPSHPSSKKESALAALQKGDALERRASRRFSAYQFAKLTNGGVSPGLSEIVPPLPNSEFVEKNSVVLPTTSTHTSSSAEYTSSITVVDEADSPGKSFGSPLRKSTENLSQPRHSLKNKSIPENSEEEDTRDVNITPTKAERKDNGAAKSPEDTGLAGHKSRSSLVPQSISLFLQLGNKTKKSLISEASDLTLASLKLQFIEKFAYSSASLDLFPDIYILDPKTNIRYELEESNLKDIQDGTLLVLNIDGDDDLKKYFDDSFSKLTGHIKDLDKRIEENAATMKKLKDDNQKALEAAAIRPSVVTTSRTNSGNIKSVRSAMPYFSDTGAAHREVDSLRKDVAVVHQINKTSLDNVRGQLAAINNKAKQLQDLTNLSNGNSSRIYMDKCHKKLSNDSDLLLTTVDELQDIVEDMRKDVAQRGVRHSTRQLKGISKELAYANDFLAKMEKYLLAEKPSWKKIWEKELETVCEEQQFFKLQEELVADLKDDLAKATDTFSLVEAFSIEQSKGNIKRRPTPPTVNPSPVDGIVHAKDAVLSEVLALQPNHHKRLEAIERADKMRQKEKQIFGADDFEDELQEFVSENKLKKSGGVEEAERRRKLREQKVIEEQHKSESEIRALRKAEREARRKEKEAAATSSAGTASSVQTDSSISSLASSGDSVPVTASSSSPDLVDLTKELPTVLASEEFKYNGNGTGVAEKERSSNDNL